MTQTMERKKTSRPAALALAVFKRAGSKVPVDVKSAVERLGFELKSSADDMAVGITDRDKSLQIPSFLDAQQRRFMVAQLLGVHLMSPASFKADDNTVFKEQVKANAPMLFTKDRNADRFAMELLMPEPLVRQHFFNGKGPDQLSQTFGVSRAIMHARLQMLSMI